MEFNRFASSIPGKYWGCCAMETIQYMKVDPDAKHAIALINGDSGHPITNTKGQLYLGTTYGEVFKARMLMASFSSSKMPNHAFLCTMTSSQMSGVGGKWVKILAEAGFEFVRTVDNSVYSGADLLSEGDKYGYTSAHPNYLFGMFRNIGTGAIADQSEAPAEFKKHSKVKSPLDYLTKEQRAEFQRDQEKLHLARYNEYMKTFKTYSLEELYKAGLTDDDIYMAGTQMRGGQLTNPRYSESRNERKKYVKGFGVEKTSKSDPFAQVA